MTSLTFSPLRSIGRELDLSPTAWGELEDSAAIQADPTALKEKMDEDGYLFIRDFFPQEIIEAARLSLLETLAEKGIFDPAHPLFEGVLKPDEVPAFSPEAARDDSAVHRVVFGPEIKTFYERFLGGAIRHFDYIWLRSMGRGKGTNPHCDVVYMGRGTRDLYTAWIPYGNVSYEVGGLMILEKSHRQAERLKNYLNSDVDTYCVNQPERHGWKTGGLLSNNPVSLQEKLGGRWLSTEFRMGDLLTFRMETVHGSIDNQTDRLRLSSDTRYQLATEPVDERWVGENPVGHATAGKRGRIC